MVDSRSYDLQGLRQESRTSDRLTDHHLSLHGVRQGLFDQGIRGPDRRGDVGKDFPPALQQGVTRPHPPFLALFHRQHQISSRAFRAADKLAPASSAVFYCFFSLLLYYNVMPSVYLKTVSLSLLVVILFLFTGISSLVSAPVKAASKQSCCDACNTGKAQNTNACSTPDCPLYLCLTANLTSPVSPVAPEVVRSVSSFVAVHSPFSAVKAVFHPPANS